jgi:hypothetical protein
MSRWPSDLLSEAHQESLTEPYHLSTTSIFFRPRTESATLSPERAPPAKKVISDTSTHLCPAHTRLLQVARDSYELYRKALEEAETADQQAEEEVIKLTRAKTELNKTATRINRKE